MGAQDWLLFSLAIGIAVGSLIFAALSRPGHSLSTRRALAVASYSIGLAITWYFYKTPVALQSVLSNVVGYGIAILLAALGAALFFWRIRSL